MNIFDLQSFSYEERTGLLPELTEALTHSGGWVLERRTLSATTMEFLLEIQLAGIVELYSALIGTGLELTRTTHNTLTDLCTCRHHGLHAPAHAAQVVSLRLELSFLEEITLHSLRMTGCGAA